MSWRFARVSATSSLHGTTSNESNGSLRGSTEQTDGDSMALDACVRTSRSCKLVNAVIKDISIESKYHENKRWKVVIVLPNPSCEICFSISSGNTVLETYNELKFSRTRPKSPGSLHLTIWPNLATWT